SRPSPSSPSSSNPTKHRSCRADPSRLTRRVTTRRGGDRVVGRMEPLAMFPLGSPLLPGSTIRLQVFEPRYLTMVADLLAADAPGDRPPALEFGVVLIERGHEVGGGDVRSSIGCLARVLDLHS